MLLDQNEIKNNIEELMKMCKENNEFKERDLKVCESQIMEIQEKIHEG